MEKYKERARELLENWRYYDEDGIEVIPVFEAYKIAVQLAEEVEKENNIFYTFDQDGDMCKTNIIFPNTPLFVSEEDCIGFLKYQEDVYKKKINKLNLYTKEQVEELLQKQRELIIEKAQLDFGVGGYVSIDYNSILNAKLEI